MNDYQIELTDEEVDLFYNQDDENLVAEMEIVSSILSSILVNDSDIFFE